MAGTISHMSRSTPRMIGIIMGVLTIIYISCYTANGLSSSLPLSVATLIHIIILPIIAGYISYFIAYLWRARWWFVMAYRANPIIADFAVENRVKSAMACKGKMKSSDIIVATPEKSGTTWLQHMAHQLRANGAEPTFEDQNDVMPIIESHYAWYGRAATDEPQPYGPRIFKSHMSLNELHQCGLAPLLVQPVVADASTGSSWSLGQWISRNIFNIKASLDERAGSGDKSPSSSPSSSLSPSLQYGRLIFCWRAREDVIHSWYRFMPPFVHIHPDWMPFDVFANLWLGFLLKNEMQRLQSLVDFWRLRHHPHILFNFYEDLVADHKGSLVRLAKWMEIKNDSDSNSNDDKGYSDELIERVRQQTTHKAMSSDEHIGRFSDIRAREQWDIKLKYPAHKRLTPQQLKETGKVRRTGGDSAEYTLVINELRRRLQDMWSQVVTPQLGFANLDEMRRHWHIELATTQTPLNIQLP